MSLEAGRLKERGVTLPEPMKPLPQRKGAPWQIEGLGTQGSFVAISQVKAMAQLGGMPINSLFIGVSDRNEGKLAAKALKEIKAGILDKIVALLGIKKEFPPYSVSMPQGLGLGIGDALSAQRVHRDVIKWIEAEMVPWSKEHFAPHLWRAHGIGWTGCTSGIIKDAILATEGWAQRQFRVAYVHIANQPPRTLQFLKAFLEFSELVCKEYKVETRLMPTFDATIVSYEGHKPPSDRPWNEMAWNWKTRITREKAIAVHNMALSVISRGGLQPSLKETLLLAEFSPIKSLYIAEQVQVTPVKKMLIGTKVVDELNREGIRSCTRDVLNDLKENGVGREIVLVCFGQLSESWQEEVKGEAENLGLDARINVVGLRFGCEYSFIVGIGPIVNRPVRFLEEPFGLWKGSDYTKNEVIDELIPGEVKSNGEGNAYLKTFDVYARAIGLKSGFEIFAWRF
jgi:hypothetical protein